MALDPSIPLGVNQNFTPPGPEQMLSLAAMAQQMKAQQAEQQKQNALKGIFSDPSNLDPESGLPTTTAISKIASVDPQMGLKVAGEVGALKTQAIDAKLATSKLYEEKVDTLSQEAVSPALKAYESAIESGIPKDQAKAQAQKVLNDGYDKAKKAGIYSAEEIANWPREFQPEAMAAHDERYQLWKAKADEAKRAEKKEADEASYRMREAADREKQIAQEGAYQKGELALRAKEINVQASGQGKWEILTDPTTNTQYRYNPVTGKATTLDGKKEVTPGGAQKLGSGNPRSAQALAVQAFVDDYAKAHNGQKPSGQQILAFNSSAAGMRRAATVATNAENAVNEVQRFVPIWQDAISKLPNSKIVAFNRLIQAGQKETNDPQLAAALVAAFDLAGASARANNPQSAVGGDVETRNEARKLFGTLVDKDAAKAIGDQVLKNAAAAKAATLETESAANIGFAGATDTAPAPRAKPTVSGWN